MEALSDLHLSRVTITRVYCFDKGLALMRRSALVNMHARVPVLIIQAVSVYLQLIAVSKGKIREMFKDL